MYQEGDKVSATYNGHTYYGVVIDVQSDRYGQCVWIGDPESRMPLIVASPGSGITVQKVSPPSPPRQRTYSISLISHRIR